MAVINRVAEFHEEITEYRRKLHQYPQTAYEEIIASDLVKEKLTEWGIPFKTGYAKTGLVATIEGQKTESGKKLGLRADMDALNIHECSGQPWTSKHDGKMHACGHDGHTAMMLGTAKYLQETKNFDGTVNLIFQPAEEGEKGALNMIKDGLFKDFPIDYIFGVHNWPTLEKGKIDMRVGSQMAAMDVFEIKVIGKGGHAAIPHNVIDPIVITSHIISALQTIVSRNVAPTDTAVISITNINAGTGAINIIPQEATITGTVRTLSSETQSLIEKRIKEISRNIAQSMGGDIEIVNYKNTSIATINTADGIEIAKKAAIEVIGEENLNANCLPTLASEDFGAMLAEIPGAYVFLGQKETDDTSPHSHGLHSPKYDFNDDVIPTGISYFVKIIETYMPLNK